MSRESGELMPIIKFVNEKKEIQVPEGSNLRHEALQAGGTSVARCRTRSAFFVKRV